MKALVFSLLLTIYLATVTKGQSHDVQQLLLNWEKLQQLRSILKNMYDGYKVISWGYTAVKNISEGNFQLHQVFLDRLLSVSPAVRKYKKVAEIVRLQRQLMTEQKTAFSGFKSTGAFTARELSYLEKVYTNVFRQSLKSLDELLMVVTANNLRMADAERFQAIDRIFEDLEDKLNFLRSFNSSNKVLVMARSKAKTEIRLSERLSGLK